MQSISPVGHSRLCLGLVHCTLPFPKIITFFQGAKLKVIGAELRALMGIMGITGDAPMVLYEGLLGSAGIVFDTHKAV